VIQKVIKVGNSAAVTLPKEILMQSKLSSGDKVHVTLDEVTGVIIVSGSENPFKGLSPDIAAWTKNFIAKNRAALEELANK